MNYSMPEEIRLGLKENWKQFTLLVIINAFVGGMVGLERSIFPQFAEESFGITSHSAVLSFITAFGISKALANYYTGRLANRLGRRNLLLIGWLLAIPIPFLLIYAGSWNWVVFANVLLGISQGLTWSSTVVMKIDLVGERQSGLAMGLNDLLGVGTYSFIDTGVIGTDAIRVGLLYKPGTVRPAGDFAILDSSVDPAFIDTKNRPVLIQTFEELATGARFTVAVNHLKSKGSPCDSVGDPDAGLVGVGVAVSVEERLDHPVLRRARHADGHPLGPDANRAPRRRYGRYDHGQQTAPHASPRRMADHHC